ncbi:PiggyBac transposable element-derived protein 4 [Eumeta japonica]|uniref:PiggyBac transposable element-derived protein 4 n=1 Tax=Eumeta variegata TaxID=151549 RepID=A0A4C1U6G7_EUMVA|nr:PiggyBac transposable element-derived protein 4 [Eumeta japonica]
MAKNGELRLNRRKQRTEHQKPEMDLRSQNEKILQWLEESDTESIPDNQSQSDSEEDNSNLETEIHFETDESDEDVAVSSEDDVFVSRAGRSRRLVIDSDSDDGTPTTFGSNQIVDVNNEHTQHQQSVIQPRQNTLYGKNQHKWSTIPRDPRTRTGARNVLHIVPGPVGISKEFSEPKDLFHLFIPEEIIDIIVQYSNIEINIKNNKYKTSKYTTTQTSANEIKALLGLLIQFAALKSNHLPTRTLFDTLRSAKTYKACMSAERFDFLLGCIRFDDKNTRRERRESDRLAPIRDVWEKFIENCKKLYKPGSYITVDEQLVGFRGRCPFRMYIPNKPNKYGLKLVMIADSSTKYMCNAIPYMGKNTNTGNEPLANYFVKELCKPYQGSNRNITMDNWFTSVPLAAELLKPPYKFTVVGTLRSNKREIPKEMVNTRNRPVGNSIFGFDKEMTLVSYKPKTNKIAYLLSTTHDQPSINANSKKPEIIEFYNSTKGAVDTVDQMCSIMSTSRKTNRWPICLFFNILNLTIVNAYVIHVSNAIRNGTKPMKRRPFALQLADDLMKPWLQERYQTVTLQRNLKLIIAEILKINDPQEGPSHDVPKTRKFATSVLQKRRMTTTFCKVQNTDLQEHVVSMCNLCSG